MHEVSLLESLIEQVQEIGAREKFTKVLEIRLSVGALSGVDPSCLEFCYSEVISGSILDGARLVLERVGLELRCENCGEVSKPTDSSALFCEMCSSGQVRILRGREFKIVDLEVA